jgi:hypothetical protein
MCSPAGGRKIEACQREPARAGTASKEGGTLRTDPDPAPSRVLDSRGDPPSGDSPALEHSRPLRRRTLARPGLQRRGLRRVSVRPSPPLRKEPS